MKLHPTRREFLTAGSAALAYGVSHRTSLAAVGTPLEFMVVGDWGRDGAFHQRQVAAAMGEFGETSFVVTTGDNFYQHGVKSIHDRKWDSSFEQIYTNVPQRWYAVLGNHDYGGSVEAQITKTFHDSRWRMPDYWYDVRLDAYGRPEVHLFFINTVAWRGYEKFPYTILGSSVRREDPARQREWLKKQLRESNAPVKIAFGHHPIYSVRTKGSYYGMPDLDALLFDHGVIAYVNGHDHNMYHISAPDWRGASTHRMHYICSGAGSQMRPTYPNCGLDGLVSQNGCASQHRLGARKPFWHAFFTKSETFSRIDLQGGFAVFSVHADRLGIRFIEPVEDLPAGRSWRERYSTVVQLGGAGRQVLLGV